MENTVALIGIKSLGELKESGYKPRSIKEELRNNLILKLKQGKEIFPGVLGYGETVIPEIERAILSKHNINLLGLRGQAKTRLARQLTHLLDEFIPVIEGSEINDDPFAPLSVYGKNLVKDLGDNTPISWWHRSDRYAEKLATPDVTVADLIGDVDPIKAANLKLNYGDERTLHFGIIPRSNRGIFVINELPDLQPRIQVALFNILQEGDIQIRGFKVRMPLDIQFIFTANPEDYTNRGSIVTPLKDRIGSQIITHYPKDIEVSKMITRQEAKVDENVAKKIHVSPVLETILEQIGFEARDNEYIDKKSGVSARLSISAYENLISTAELRMIQSGDEKTTARMSDLFGVIPAITGKVELVYEGEQEGHQIVARHLIGKSIRKVFPDIFPSPEKRGKKEKTESPYQEILEWFSAGNTLDLISAQKDVDFKKSLNEVSGLAACVKKMSGESGSDEAYFLMELMLFGLAEFSKLNKSELVNGNRFDDLFSSVLGNSFS
jgi:magnesium chelatase subunit I